jgi:hypothetical protein
VQQQRQQSCVLTLTLLAWLQVQQQGLGRAEVAQRLCVPART